MGFKRTIQLLRQPPWHMECAATYLEDWLAGRPYALATAQPPTAPSWMQMAGEAGRAQMPAAPEHDTDFAHRPPKILKVGAGAANPVPGPAAKAKGKGKGTGGRRGPSRGKRKASDLRGFSDLSGIELLDGVSSPSSHSDGLD